MGEYFVHYILYVCFYFFLFSVETGDWKVDWGAFDMLLM